MEEFKKRQTQIAIESINDFYEKKLSLNALIQRIEGVKNALEDERLSDDLYRCVLVLEEINGLAMSENRLLSDEEQAIANQEASQVYQIFSAYQV